MAGRCSRTCKCTLGSHQWGIYNRMLFQPYYTVENSSWYWMTARNTVEIGDFNSKTLIKLYQLHDVALSDKLWQSQMCKSMQHQMRQPLMRGSIKASTCTQGNHKIIKQMNGDPLVITAPYPASFIHLSVSKGDWFAHKTAGSNSPPNWVSECPDCSHIWFQGVTQWTIQSIICHIETN